MLIPTFIDSWKRINRKFDKPNNLRTSEIDNNYIIKLGLLTTKIEAKLFGSCTLLFCEVNFPSAIARPKLNILYFTAL